MQDALAGMRRLSTSAGPVRLRMSFGLHAGDFHFFLVGGIHRELVIAGLDATTCVETEAIATAGEIALSAATARLIDRRLLGERRDGVVLLAGSPDGRRWSRPSSILRGSTSAAPTRRLHAGASGNRPTLSTGMSPLHSSRSAGPMSCSSGGRRALAERSTSGSRRSRRLPDVRRHLRADGREQGAVKAILLAGAPVARVATKRSSCSCRPGRSSSSRDPAGAGRRELRRVFAGIVGHPTRRTYTFYGDAINTAARIMARAADGQLLAREDVLERARTTYAITPIRAVPRQGQGRARSGLRRRRRRRRARAGGSRPVRRARGRSSTCCSPPGRARRGGAPSHSSRATPGLARPG